MAKAKTTPVVEKFTGEHPELFRLGGKALREMAKGRKSKRQAAATAELARRKANLAVKKAGA